MTNKRDGSLRAVLFDMDGLLVDTEPQWFAAEQQTAAWLGGSWTRADQHALLGSNLEFAGDYLVRHTKASVSRAAVMTHLRSAMTSQLRRDGATLHDGALDLINAVRAAGVPLGLVTSSVREHVDIVLRQLPDGVFDVVVTAESVARRKPHPDPYLTATSQLGVSADSTVALEDSPTGVAAAEDAGCAVVAVPSVVDVPAGPRRLVVSSLRDVNVEVLEALVTRW